VTPEAREQLRISLLRFLSANPSKFGLPVKFLTTHAKMEGRPQLTQDQVEAELTYLADKGLVAELTKAISPEVRSYRITAEGRDYLAALGVD
jgi:hypothetical protein